MPTPGFPDWASVGAIVRPTHPMATGGLFVITRIEFQPADLPEAHAGAYAIVLNPIYDENHSLPRRVPLARVWDDARVRTVVNLPMLLENYEWTGEYLDENEQIIGVGTTMPVTMYAQGLAPGDEVIIQGSPNHDGVFRVGYAQHQHIMLNRDHEPVTPEVEEAYQRERAATAGGWAADYLGPANPRTGADEPYMRTDGFGRDRTGLVAGLMGRLMGSDGVDEPQPGPQFPSADYFGQPANPDALSDAGAEMEEVLADAGTTMRDAQDFLRAVQTIDPDSTAAQDAHEHMQRLANQDVLAVYTQVAQMPLDPPYGLEEMDRVFQTLGLPETDVPQVAVSQVWLLPRPNDGRWRVAAAGVLEIRLEHIRERDRYMTCTRAWLVQHGTRQEPPDPRARVGATSPVAKGQVWEIDPSNTKYSNSKNRMWRVQTIDERAGRLMLVAEDGSGKRLYWAPSRLLAVGTFAGDGSPRRTAYEHVLADELDDDP